MPALASKSSRMEVQTYPAASTHTTSGRLPEQPVTQVEVYEKHRCMHFSEYFLISLPPFPTQILTSTLFFFRE